MTARPIALVAGVDVRLAGHVISSLPADLIDGFLLVGPKPLAPLRWTPGCRGHIVSRLGTCAKGEVAQLVARHPDRKFVAVAADDPGQDWLSSLTTETEFAGSALPDCANRTRLRDKWAFHSLCIKLGVPVPQTRCFANKYEIPISQMLEEMDGQLVIKPLAEAGGKGIVVVHDRQQFDRHIIGNPAYDHAPLLVQQFIEGEDLGLSLLAREGRILHHCIQVYRGDLHHFLPHRAYLEAVRRLIEYTGYTGLAHFDAQWGPDGTLALLECNTRPWASISQSTWGGLNFVRAQIAEAIGVPHDTPAHLEQGNAPRVLDWWRRNFWRPGALARLSTDQHRLALLRPPISLLVRGS